MRPVQSLLHVRRVKIGFHSPDYLKIKRRVAVIIRKHRRNSRYRDGDNLIQSDLTGRICYASETVKLWNGLICHRSEYEERNPQDFLKARPEREPFKEVRPRTDRFISEPITPDDL